MTNKKDAPIGVFDSGMGGISVLRELVKIMPNEDYIFFGDSANAPYGIKTVEEVQKLSFEKVEHLLSYNCKAIVVACNTATSAAIKELRTAYPDLIIVGLEPALKPAVEHKKDSKVILALISFHPRFINQAPLFYPRDPAHKQDSCLKGREEKNRPFSRKSVCCSGAPMHRYLFRQKRESHPCGQESDCPQDPGFFIIKK